MACTCCLLRFWARCPPCCMASTCCGTLSTRRRQQTPMTPASPWYPPAACCCLPARSKPAVEPCPSGLCSPCPGHPLRGWLPWLTAQVQTACWQVCVPASPDGQVCSWAYRVLAAAWLTCAVSCRTGGRALPCARAHPLLPGASGDCGEDHQRRLRRAAARWVPPHGVRVRRRAGPQAAPLLPRNGPQRRLRLGAKAPGALLCCPILAPASPSSCAALPLRQSQCSCCLRCAEHWLCSGCTELRSPLPSSHLPA